MAEVFGAVASAAGLISLALELLERAEAIRAFYSRTRSAPDKLLSLGEQLETVSLLLRQLETIGQCDGHDVELLGRCVSQCQHSAAQMDKLLKKLLDRLSRLKILGRISIALRDDEFTQLMDEIERAKSSVMLAFQMYTFSRHTKLFEQQRSQLIQIQRAIEQVGQASLTSSSHDTSSCRIVDVTDSDNSDAPIPDSTNLNSGQSYQTTSSESLSRRRKRRLSRPRYELTINRSWLTSKIWHIATVDAENGWDFRIRSWNLRPRNYDIFRACRRGDLLTVQRLLRTGEASIYDYYEEWGCKHFTLLHVAAEAKQVDLCRFLLSETHMSYSGIAEHALNNYYARDSDSGDDSLKASMLALFLQESDMDADIYAIGERSYSSNETVPRWLYRCTEQAMIRDTLRHQCTRYSSWPIDNRIRIAMVASGFSEWPVHRLSSRQRSLGWIGVDAINHEIASFKESDGYTLLHNVTTRIGWGHGLVHGLMRDADLKAEVEFAAELIAYGSEIEDTSHATPLMAMMKKFVWGCCCRPCFTWSVQECMKLWYRILQRSGRQRKDKARSEQDLVETIWDSEARIWIQDDGTNWKVELQIVQELELYKLNALPGSWHSEPAIPRTIFWRPSFSERLEGHWTKVKTLSMQSYSCIVTKDTESEDVMSIFAESVLDVQDDHGIIALRVNQRKHEALRRRSCSFSQLLRPQKHHCWRPGGKILLGWTKQGHFCLHDGRFRLDCEGLNVGDARRCLRGFSRPEECVQETVDWRMWSFAATHPWQKRR